MIKNTLGKSISEKFFGKKTGNVEQERNNKLGLSALKIIAKDTLIFSKLALELKTINRSFKQLVRLEGGQPADSESLKSYNNKYGSMKELHIADRKVKRMKEEQRPADFLVVLFEKFMIVLKLVFLGTLLSGIILAEKISEWMDIKGMYTKLTSFFSEISNGVINFFRGIDWASEFQSHIGDIINFISFGMFTKKDAMLIVEGAGNFTSGIMHRFGEVLLSAAKILKEHLEKLGRFLAIDVLGVDYEEMERQKKERDSAVELSESLKKDNDTLDVEMKSLQDKRNMLNEKKFKREKDAATQRVKQAEEEAKKRETVGDKLKRVFTPKEAVVEEKPIKVSTGAEGFGLTARPTAAPSSAPTPTPAKIPDDIKQNITKQDKKAEETTKPKPADAKSSGDEGMQYPTTKGQAVVTSKYGMRMHPVKKEIKLHTGLDYAGVPENSPIQLVSSAKIQKAGMQTGYGNMIDAQINGETLRFAHLNKMFVKAGDMIEPGTIIGLLGATGIGTGAHLHFEHRSQSSFGDGDKTTYDPLKTGAPSLIAIGDKPVRMIADQTKRYDDYVGENKNQLSAESSSLAQAQRNQSKRQNPVIINAPNTNNTLIKNQNNVVATG
jgi:murein DD-endopeptidase MepM/ murein hydrolase activator NlpD